MLIFHHTFCHLLHPLKFAWAGAAASTIWNRFIHMVAGVEYKQIKGVEAAGNDKYWSNIDVLMENLTPKRVRQSLLDPHSTTLTYLYF